MNVFSRILRVAMTPQILLMVSKVYIPTLFPVTFLIALTSRMADGALQASLGNTLGLDLRAGFLPVPMNYGLAAASMAFGLLIVGISYAELVVRGEGSPSPTAGRTIKLVRTGIYAYSRNPSVIGKLFGVLSVGFVLNSFSFCFLLLPVILAGSLIEKVVRQEPQLVEIFGDEYEQYRKEVPLFFPWTFFLPRKKH